MDSGSRLATLGVGAVLVALVLAAPAKAPTSRAFRRGSTAPRRRRAPSPRTSSFAPPSSGAASARAEAAGRRQQALEAELSEGRARLERLKDAAVAAHRRLLGAQARYRRSQRRLSERLVAIYKADTPDLTTVLLESDGFSDLLTRIQYLKEINGADTALVGRVEELRNGVRSALGRVRYLRRWQATRCSGSGRRATRSRAFALRRRRRLRTCAVRAGSPAGSARRICARGWRIGRRRCERFRLRVARAAALGRRLADGSATYTIPQSIVMCESGGNYSALNPSSGAGGAYQFLPDTYRGLGGRLKRPPPPPQEGNRPSSPRSSGGVERPAEVGVLGGEQGGPPPPGPPQEASGGMRGPPKGGPLGFGV